MYSPSILYSSLSSSRTKVCRRSLSSALTLYIFAGVFGFLTFRSETESNILLNNYNRDVSVIVAALVVCFSITLTIPLFVHAWRKNFIEYVSTAYCT